MMSSSSSAMIQKSTMGVEGSEFISSGQNTTVNKNYYNLNLVFPNVTSFFQFVAKHLVLWTRSPDGTEPGCNTVEISDIMPPDLSSLPPVSSVADRYTRYMLEFMVGYPLYNPKPFSELSMEYTRNGLVIGDVGFVREDGTFDFLFNVCRKDSLINPPYLPDDFFLETYGHSTTRAQESLPRGRCFFPQTVIKTESDEYICKGPDGAILILPEGAIQHEAVNNIWFEDIAKCQGVNWYKYAMNQRGRSIPNGSLYLVTSFTKSISWGIGVFDRACDPGQGLTFVSSLPSSSWNGQTVFTTKVAEPNQGDTPNQCVFLRGYKIKLQKEIFDNLRNKRHRISDPMLSGRSGLTLTRQKARRIRGGGGTDFLSKILPGGNPWATQDSKSDLKKSDEDHEVVLLHDDFSSSPLHPSDLINTSLLEQNPDAKVSLIHDDVWCELLRENFPTLNYATLINIARSYTSIVDKYGCISLEKNDPYESKSPVQRTETLPLQKLIHDAKDERNLDDIGGGKVYTSGITTHNVDQAPVYNITIGGNNEEVNTTPEFHEGIGHLTKNAIPTLFGEFRKHDHSKFNVRESASTARVYYVPQLSIQEHDQDVLQELKPQDHATTIFKEFVSFKALYNPSAQDPTRRVHPGTRQRVLKCIQDWISTPSAKERIFWLHGPAGVGKSAIAQTIAESLACSRGQLVATFFFFRSDPSRNDGNHLFTTLAWQFAFAIPAMKSIIIRSLNEHPDIPMKNIETQFEELIVKPFLALKGSGIELRAPVVIIDGVNECSDESLQRRFIKLIGNAVKDDCVPLRFLISSRPEAHIQDMVNIFQSLTLSLDLAKLDDANEDIEKYLRVEFSQIASEQELDSAWPGEEIIQEFVYKASGQFIYASMIIKYVGDEYCNAEIQLEIIRGLKPPLNISPFAELDELYKEILRQQHDRVFLKDFLSMLIGRHETKKDHLHEDDTLLMNVSEKELHMKLRRMRSILKFDPYIDVYHRSFLDFLQDPVRSGEYHISKEAGARRYMDFIVGALVRYASTVNVQHNDHFKPRFYELSAIYPPKHVMSVDEWQEALQPLLELQDKLLASPNFRIWEFLPCRRCTGFHTIRNLLLHLTFLLGSSSCNSRPALTAESHADEPEQLHRSENDLDACLSSLLLRLRLGLLFDPVTIQLFCSLLCFDHVEITMRLQSISDSQNLVDLIDELINNKHFFSDFGSGISRKAVLLALEIFGSVPILPRSLFSKGTIGPHHDVRPAYSDANPETELLFHTVFMSKVLDSHYVVRVLWVYQDQCVLSVTDKTNDNNEPLSKWRKHSSPSSATQIRVMLGVAKAIQYFHSIGVVLHDGIDSDHIFLDLKLHPRFRLLGLTDRYVQVTPLPFVTQSWLSHEDNVLLFGCLFYEMCFNTKIHRCDRISDDKEQILAILANRPSKPDIDDNVWQLIQHCCTKDPKIRLSMDAVVKEMDGWGII